MVIDLDDSVCHLLGAGIELEDGKAQRQHALRALSPLALAS